MKKLIVKYLNRQYPFDNGFIIHNDKFNINYIKEDLKYVFGGDTLKEFNIFTDWLYILFPDKVIKVKDSDGSWLKSTYNDNGNQLTFEDSRGYWYKKTFDKNGNKLTYENSTGYCSKSTYDSNGNQLTGEDSTGYWFKCTFDGNGKQLTYENSYGIKTNLIN